MPDKPSVLVVEDNRDNREMLAQYLAALGFTVTTAANSDEALARAEELRPNVVLMDLALPGTLDGWETTRRARANPAVEAHGGHRADRPWVWRPPGKGHARRLSFCGAQALRPRRAGRSNRGGRTPRRVKRLCWQLGRGPGSRRLQRERLTAIKVVIMGKSFSFLSSRASGVVTVTAANAVAGERRRSCAT